jgi:3-deoxy-D-manno-octulosonic-acid transferase
MIILLRLLSVFHRILAVLVGPVFCLAKSGRLRWRFERENLGEYSQPFSADVDVERLYHLSSEGEWEQSYPLIDFDLQAGRKIEIVVTSLSLTNRIKTMMERWPRESFRLRRLPLIRRGPWAREKASLLGWSRARSVFLCRYDFYPELMLLGLRARKRGGDFVLVSASLINKEAKSLSFFKRWWWRGIHQCFNKRVLASSYEKARFHALLGEKNTCAEYVYDFRDLQITARLNQRQLVLEGQGLEGLQDWLALSPHRHRLICGSSWDFESRLFQGPAFCAWLQAQKIKIVFVPHDLSADSLRRQANLLISLGHRAVISNGRDPIDPNVTMVILNKRGVLVELYPEFALAYIGGGFGRSIHSVKEPFLANCHVIVGPRLHRSTEWEDILSKAPERVKSIAMFEDFALLVQSNLKNPPAFVKSAMPSYNELYQQKEQEAKLIYAQLIGADP